MHPRIKDRYVDNLHAKRARTLQRADDLGEIFVARLAELRDCINAVNAAGTLTIPDDFTDFLSNTTKAFRQLDLDLNESYQRVEEMRLKVELVGQLLNASLRLQAAKLNLDEFQPCSV